MIIRASVLKGRGMTVCVSCNGRGWKYVSLRREVIAGSGRATVPIARVRDDCSMCQKPESSALNGERM